jgi:hypothetical protein
MYLFIELMHIYAPKGGQHVDSTTILLLQFTGLFIKKSLVLRKVDKTTA